MASKSFFIAAAIVAVVVAPALATDFIVGDDKGWTVDFDYQAWTRGKTFYVGDRLIFKYKAGAHNVYKVNGTDFQQCALPLTSSPLTSGKDVIPLSTPGRKWYICGVADHCTARKMKFVITVMRQVGYPTPPPTPSPAPISGWTSSDLTPVGYPTLPPSPSPAPFSDWTSSDLTSAWSPM